MMENSPNLVKEIDIKPQEAQRIPKNRDPKRPTPGHLIIKMPKVKYKERILKAAREKQIVTYSHKTGSCFLKRNYAGQKGLAENIRCNEDPGSTTSITLSSKAII